MKNAIFLAAQQSPNSDGGTGKYLAQNESVQDSILQRAMFLAEFASPYFSIVMINGSDVPELNSGLDKD